MDKFMIIDTFLREWTIFVKEHLEKPFGIEAELGWENYSSREE